jgi:hypothetical protein
MPGVLDAVIADQRARGVRYQAWMEEDAKVARSKKVARTAKRPRSAARPAAKKPSRRAGR